MISLRPDAMQQVADQLGVLNVFVGIYLISKGVGYVTSVVMRRDPPTKTIRSKLAQSNESQSTGRVVDERGGSDEA